MLERLLNGPLINKSADQITVKSQVREWVESVAFALCLALLLRTFFIQAYKIPSGSMRMTLMEGDRLMVNKLRYGARLPWAQIRLPGLSAPKRGDIIVFDYPVDPSREFIKRLIALGGEAVEIRDGQIFVDDSPVSDPRIADRTYYNLGPLGQQGEKIEVPEGFAFVLGDNSASSADSRYWGFVPEHNIVGRAEFIYWPPSRMGILK